MSTLALARWSQSNSISLKAVVLYQNLTASQFCLSHWLSGWPKKSPNFIFATKVVFPKSLKVMNSGSGQFCLLKEPLHAWNYRHGCNSLAWR